jgi:hypothetical protein
MSNQSCGCRWGINWTEQVGFGKRYVVVDYLFLAEIENLDLNGVPRLGSQFQAKKSLDSHSSVRIPKKCGV